MVYNSQLTNIQSNGEGGWDDFNVMTQTIETIKPAGQEKTPPGIFHLANKWGNPLALN